MFEMVTTIFLAASTRFLIKARVLMKATRRQQLFSLYLNRLVPWFKKKRLYHTPRKARFTVLFPLQKKKIKNKDGNAIWN